MKEKLLTMIAGLLFLIGAAIFFYPYAMDWYYDYHTDRVLASYKEEMENLQKEAAEESSDALETDNQKAVSKISRRLDDLYEEMVQYNQEIYENRQQDLEDPFFYESVSFDLTQYGLEDNLIGYLTIPAMELELPVYLGATTKNLAKGAAHLGQTSMPVGGENTNVVLAAHRGYRGIPMFREIEKLKQGDIVTFTTPFDTLTYQVTGMEIILPEDINKIRIQTGKDMLTLFTCHPYRENSHRYVVYCERTFLAQQESDEEQDHQQPSEESIEISSSGEAEIYTGEVSADASSQSQILLDKYVPIVGIVFLAVVFILCFIGLKKKK